VKIGKLFLMLCAVTLLAKSGMAQGVFGGDKKHPIPVAWGQVQKIIQKGPPLKLESQPTKIQVKLSDMYYEAVADSGGLFKPTSGEVQKVVLGDLNLELASKDLSGGVLDTRDFGKLALFVVPNMTGPDRWIVAVTDEQLKKIQQSVKKNEVE